MHIPPSARAVHWSDHSEVSCFLCEQTFVVNYAPDMSLSTRCQWFDADTHVHDECDADELAPQTVEWAEASSPVPARDQ
jgi:hypothetical protein